MRCAPCLSLVLAAPSLAQSFDVVVYGGSAAGVVAAAEVAGAGHRVALIEPTQHLGGMTASGLGATDIGNKEVIGGRARAFYRAVRAHYAGDEAWTWQERRAFRGRGHDAGDDAAWTFEPHVAERILERWAAAAGITLLRGERLDRERGAELRDGRIARIPLRSG